MKKRHVIYNIACLFFFTLIILAAHRWLKLTAIVPALYPLFFGEPPPQITHEIKPMVLWPPKKRYELQSRENQPKYHER